MEWGRSMYALAESGWDCTSRFAFDAHLHAPADLNSLLYLLECNMAYFAQVLDDTDGAVLWKQRSEQRAQRINELLWSDSRGVFCDFNFTNNTRNDMVSSAAFYPLFTGLATAEQAEHTAAALPYLEYTYGIACCEDNGKLVELQWDHPHGWACLHYLAVRGLLNYGKTEDALRIAKKYVDTAAENFRETDNLWEKYNVVTGKVSVTKEYDTPPMMGWSAGVFLYCCQLLRRHNRI